MTMDGNLGDEVEPLFRDRTPEAAARQCATVLAWLTECQLETLEQLAVRSGTAKSALLRQEKICEVAVRHCAELGVRPVGLNGDPCVRLARVLRPGGIG